MRAKGKACAACGLFAYPRQGKENVRMKREFTGFTKKIICITVILAVGCISFFAVAPWAENPANYPKTMETLDSIENKAIVMTGTSIALATAAALVPGDATTPIANKLADVAGYMVIVYAAIVIEKYLLALTGSLTFKLLIPFALLLLLLRIAVPALGERINLKRIAAKFVMIGVLLWGLGPTSATVTNLINNTYEFQYGEETAVEASAAEADSETEDSGLAEQQAENQTQKEEIAGSEEESFSFHKMWNSIAEKTSEAADSVKTKASTTVAGFQASLSHMLEGVAVMIVTTCGIPLGVLFLFLWIIKALTGMNVPIKMPKASKLLPTRGAKGSSGETEG